MICNGNRTERSPIQSVIIRLITKLDDPAAGVRFVYHNYYDDGPNWTKQSLIIQLIIEIIISENRRIAKVMKERENLYEVTKSKLLAIETKVVISYR